MEHGDIEIIRGLIAGDQRSFSMLIRLYFQPLTLYAKSIINDTGHAQDTVQEVLLKLWNMRENLNITTSLKSFLYRSVHNACIDFLRNNKTREDIQAISYDDSQFRLKIFEITEDNHFFDFYFSDDLETRIKQAIDHLPPQCKEIFILSRFGQLSYPQISEKLSLSLSTVKTQMVRAVHKLQEELKKYL